LAIWGFGATLGYLATYAAKSDIIFLKGNPSFLQRRWNFAPISLSFPDQTHGRQTHDRCSDRNRRLSHLCEPDNSSEEVKHMLVISSLNTITTDVHTMNEIATTYKLHKIKNTG